MERFQNGPFPKTPEIYKWEKRIVRCNRYERARKLARLLLAIALPIILAVTALFDLRSLLLAAPICVGIVLLVQVGFLLGSLILRLPRVASFAYDELLNTYMRLLVKETHRLYSPHFPDCKLKGEMLDESERYARQYAVPEEAKPAFYEARDIAAEGERLRAEFEEYLEKIASPEGEKLLLKKAEFVRRTDRWRKMNRRSYNEDQYRMVDENINRLLQKFSHDANAENGYYMDFETYITAFHGKDKESRRYDGLIIPTIEVQNYYVTLVKLIKRIRLNELKKALSDKELDNLRDYLRAYRQIRQKYAFSENLPTIDLERYIKYYQETVINKKRCFSCHRKYHERYKKICSRCGHYICPRCHKCYCSKYIGHSLENFYYEV